MMTFLRNRGSTIAVAALTFVAGGATVTTAASLITSADIKDGTIQSVDIHSGAVTNADIADNAVGTKKIANGGVGTKDILDSTIASADIHSGGVNTADLADNAVSTKKIANGGVATKDILDGTIQIGDISVAAQDALTAYSGANWGVMDRSVINNGDAYLRAGPSHAPIPPAPAPQDPPFGVGSLGIRTGGRDNATGGPSDDKAAFGNEVDFANTPVSDLTAVSFYVYTTAENIASGGAANLPNISFEISANLAAVGGPVDFSTMVYEPLANRQRFGGGATPWLIPMLTGGSPGPRATRSGATRPRHVRSRT